MGIDVRGGGGGMEGLIDLACVYIPHALQSY